MNPVYSLIASAVVQLLVAAYVYGQLSNQTKNNTDSIKELKKSDDQQWKEIGELGQDVARIDGKLSKGMATGK